MSQYLDSGYATLKAGEAIARGVLVKLSSGVITAAALAEEAIGVACEAIASGDYGRVKLRSAAGTIHCLASGAFSNGAVVYGRAAGKVDDIATSSAVRIGIATESATAANDIIEVVPC